jgi:hypothetical protein
MANFFIGILPFFSIADIVTGRRLKPGSMPGPAQAVLQNGVNVALTRKPAKLAYLRFVSHIPPLLLAAPGAISLGSGPPSILSGPSERAGSGSETQFLKPFAVIGGKPAPGS